MCLKCGFKDLGFAKLDTDRKARRGFAEAIYCPGKTYEHLKKIIAEMFKRKQGLILTKLDKGVYGKLKRSFPGLKYNSLAKIGHSVQKCNAGQGPVLVISAGTSDIPVAEEAACTLELMGNRAQRLYDVGVAGVHRLMHHKELLEKAHVIVVVAGMDGALPTLVSGLVRVPVIAVPTSCGYGASFKGLAALLTMMNACSPGVVVVNIDNGFGAGYCASLVNIRKD